MPVDDYVYDYYTVKSDMEIAEDDASNPFPLCVIVSLCFHFVCFLSVFPFCNKFTSFSRIQVDDLDLYDGPDDSDYESDDSNGKYLFP